MTAVDPFARSSGGYWSRLFKAVTATAVVRCWPLLLFFTAWGAAISLIIHFVYDISIESTLLTVIGTVLGFVVSYRTTSSFDRYNEGRVLWSQIVLASRNFSRAVWFYVPDELPAMEVEPGRPQSTRVRTLLEKKTALNLIEAYAVAVKHYLRGEEGIYYVDLYHLVKYLPQYALPAGMPSQAELGDSAEDMPSLQTRPRRSSDVRSARSGHSQAAPPSMPSLPKVEEGELPLPAASSPRRNKKSTWQKEQGEKDEKVSTHSAMEEGFLLPARMPPRYHLLDLWPLSLLVRWMAKKGKDVKGVTAARMRMKLHAETVTYNLPLEISFYLSSYVAALQRRQAIDGPTTANLIDALNKLVEALTGLERILTTPIPFSYRVHLWTVTVLYNLFLPFQVWRTMGWLAIPCTTLSAFIFFGFLVAGEEIENPFGYDKNDLNMDHFTHNIIRNELRALTAQPVPDPSVWAFSPVNDQVVAAPDGERVPPGEWERRGLPRFQTALREAV